MDPIEAVTFDYWNTLVVSADRRMFERRVTSWRGVLDEAGIVVSPDDLQAALSGAWGTFQASWRSNHQYRASDARDEAVRLLGVEVDDATRDRLLEGFGLATPADGVRLAPYVEDALVALTDAGVRIGIISDVGMTPSPTLRDNLVAFGVLDHFAHWSFSDEVGVYKPAGAIFDHAREGLGCDPARTAHVGDLRRTDVAGARAAGWRSVRYTGLHDDGADGEPTAPVEADHVVADHRDLAGALGL